MRRAAALLLAVCVGAAQAQTQVRREGDAVVFEGRIDAAGAARFIELSRDTDVRRLVITSGGGLVGPALDMAEAVFDRGLDVEVSSLCLSSCANYVFPAGRRKRIARLGVVAWHGNMAHVLYRAAHGEAQWDDASMASARRLAGREAAFYARIGVDGFVAWIGKIAPYGIDEMYFLSVPDMARFGIREVEVLQPDAPPVQRADLQELALPPP